MECGYEIFYIQKDRHRMMNLKLASMSISTIKSEAFDRKAVEDKI